MKSIKVFTEEINKIALSSNDDKIIQSIDSIETYAYGTRKYLACNNIIRKCKKLLILMMLQKKNIKGHNSV